MRPCLPWRGSIARRWRRCLQRRMRTRRCWRQHQRHSIRPSRARSGSPFIPSTTCCSTRSCSPTRRRTRRRRAWPSGSCLSRTRRRPGDHASSWSTPHTYHSSWACWCRDRWQRGLWATSCTPKRTASTRGAARCPTSPRGTAAGRVAAARPSASGWSARLGMAASRCASSRRARQQRQARRIRFWRRRWRGCRRGLRPCPSQFTTTSCCSDRVYDYCCNPKVVTFV
mmetsp:Transcript_3785/g.11798  ORF Transcript_3785/g.11798 Transcript_3785/m.11798 type:complete len:227 (-) Transcript_3785:33-713(-)